MEDSLSLGKSLLAAWVSLLGWYRSEDISVVERSPRWRSAGSLLSLFIGAAPTAPGGGLLRIEKGLEAWLDTGDSENAVVMTEDVVEGKRRRDAIRPTCAGCSVVAERTEALEQDADLGVFARNVVA